jgi:hypothetical protein
MVDNFAGCCARTAIGQAAAPPMSLMNSRCLYRRPVREAPARDQAGNGRVGQLPLFSSYHTACGSPSSIGPSSHLLSTQERVFALFSGPQAGSVWSTRRQWRRRCGAATAGARRLLPSRQRRSALAAAERALERVAAGTGSPMALNRLPTTAMPRLVLIRSYPSGHSSVANCLISVCWGNAYACASVASAAAARRRQPGRLCPARAAARRKTIGPAA